MNSWFQFLQQQGAQFHNDQLTGFGEQPGDFARLLSTTLLFPLEQWATIEVQNGALDNGAHKLLQGQLTCDLDKLSSDTALFGAHCTPKGRAVANFHLAQASDTAITLILPRDQLANSETSLNKYAPFFRVKLEAGNWHLLGLAGSMATQLCQQAMTEAPEKPGQCVHSEKGTAICLEENRLLLLIQPELCEATWKQLASDAKPVGPELWNLLDIRAGIGHIRATTSEEFIPQMLNMQASHGKDGAISFKKGCYTGQEVVARMHYLGKLKRQMYRLQVPTATLNIGDHCYLPDKPQSQGNIVSLAHSDNSTMELLAVLTEPAATSPKLAFGTDPDSAQQLSTTQLPLPYSLDTEDSE